MDDRQDLIERLCTIAGMIFEDVSATAIASATDGERASEKIAHIKQAAADAEALANAASVLRRRIAN